MPIPAPMTARPAPIPAPSIAHAPVYSLVKPVAACSSGRMNMLDLQSYDVKCQCSAPNSATRQRGPGLNGNRRSFDRLHIGLRGACETRVRVIVILSEANDLASRRMTQVNDARRESDR